MIFLIIVLLLIVLFFTILCGTDFLLNQKSKFKRIHIGRWSDRKSWSEAVEQKAIKWLKHTPTVRQTENHHYVLFDIIKGTYRNKTIQSWQTAGLVLGLCSSESQIAREAVSEWQKTMMDSAVKQDIPNNKVEYAMLAYSFLKTLDPKDYETVRPAMEKVVRLIEDNLTSEGIVSYSEGKQANRYFVDTLGMVCPFLCLYGRIYQKDKYIKTVLDQIRYYTRYGMFGDTMLPCHAIDSRGHLPLSLYGWGRGTAWYVLGLIDTYAEMEQSPGKVELRLIIQKAAESYKAYQLADGGFCTILQGGDTYDSSVTSVMSYFYKSCAEIFDNSEYKDIAEKCLNRLMRVTMRDGAIDQCQGDTHGVGNFSQTFDIMPFAQGMALR